MTLDCHRNIDTSEMDITQQAQEEEFLSASSTGRESLYHATCAAELYMKAVVDATTAEDRSWLRAKFNEVVANAERLKNHNHTLYHGEQKTDIDSLCGQTLCGSPCTLHGVEFAPWQQPEADMFSLTHGHPKYVDRTDFKFSVQQKEILEGWRRPSEINPTALDNPHPDDFFMQTGQDSDLVQDITADCSVVASLCAAMRVMQTGPKSILGSIMFPYDGDKGQPAMSPSGKHAFRMFFNGCFRKVVIDDRLPCSRTDRLLYVADQKKPSLIWPALLEKAYLKVRGGYNFPGSNSGTDLFVITGWIPEQLFLQSEEFDLNQTWDRIQDAHKAGEVLITLGTGKIHPSLSRSLGLVSEHDYAVLDLATVDGGARQLLVKDPWRDSRGWKCDKRPLSERTGPRNMANAFWVSAEDATLNFETMFLNWNPNRLPYRQDLHFTWKPPPKMFTHSLAYNRQFVASATTGGMVWILLSRHFSDGEFTIIQAKTESSADTHGIGFMSIAVFQGDGKLVEDGRGAIFRGPFVGSPHTLARLFLEPGRLYTIVPLYRDLPLSEYTFSISFMSHCPLDVCHAINNTAFHAVRRGAWTRRTAGGSASSPRYYQNPQFGVSVEETTDLSILLSTDIVDIAIRADLVWSQGDRVESLEHRDLVAHSGDYERGCTLMRVRVDPGTYTIVCSTFSPGQLARFALRTSSECPLIINEVPPKAAGQLRCRLPPVMFHDGHKMQRIRVRPERLTNAIVQINPIQTRARDGVVGLTAYKITVLYGWFPRHHVLAVSSETQFRQLNRTLSSHGFDMDPTKEQLHGLWVLVEQAVSHRSDYPIDVEIICDHPVAFGSWESC